ncbi:hypothetical protein [Dyadobacter pollutisoli]|uniref:Uncharacterized protein n=1 Tax=Dyadobacter pollutisoli TaxID=2910158 RepID=A0A9E8NCQ7_9BACT|nr:hypothetical protein [Dyadobacter pollutisoli]WAC14225.1 hypothetical protein ON006_09745 [Dyadobacter pollutisoli]
MLNRYSNTTRSVIITIFTFLVVTLSRLYYVGHFAVPLPYWDQWDAEGDFLLRPWIQGTLKLRDLWQPHNEHRIFPTRVLSLIIFEVTGAWNNLTEARFNILLAAAIPALLVWILCRRGELFGIRLLLLVVVIAQFALPFSFENLLIGFQSQFYFLILFTLTSLCLATFRPFHLSTILLVLLLSVLSVLTMASGLLTSLAAACVYLLNWFSNSQKLTAKTLIISILLVSITIGGYLILPQIAANQVYRARNLSDLMSAAGYILSWPIVGTSLPAIVFWLPACIVIPMLMFRKKLTHIDILMAGCFLWSLSQGLAIAYGRGQELTEVASRYTELFSLGLIGNAWFVIRLFEILSNRWFQITLPIYFSVFLYGHITHYSSDMHDIRRNYRLSLMQTANVSMYLQTKDKSFLQKPKWQTPYPDPIRLQHLLDDPTLLKILPTLTSDNKKTASE